MGLPQKIPFEEGQNVESRSFEDGFRGAWFRSKISSISKKKTDWGFRLEFLDFPDEQNEWTKAYQSPRGQDKLLKRKNREKKELMVRPPYPQVFRERQMPDVNTISETIAVVNNTWKVGDLIDWWKDDCYWSGSITEVTEDDKFQILLLPYPFGEALAYEACSKDLRPTLEWSITSGWTVPIPKDSENGCCARIINPIKQVKSKDGVDMCETSVTAEDTVRASQSSATSWSTSQQPEHRLETVEQSASSPAILAAQNNETEDMDHNHGLIEKASSSSHSKLEAAEESPCSEKQALVSIGSTEGGSGSEAGLAVEVGEAPGENGGLDDCAPSKKKRKRKRKMKSMPNEGMGTDAMFDDSIEASLVDLEELLARIKWMKGLLQNENASTSKPLWKFIENCSSSKCG